MRAVHEEVSVDMQTMVGVAITTSLAVFLWSRSAGLATVIGTSMILSMTCVPGSWAP